MKQKTKKLPWYLQPLSPSEIRSWLRWASHREENDKLLAKQLRFMAKELEMHG